MRIIVTDETIKQVVRFEVERQNILIRLEAIDFNEINLNHIDVSNVCDFSNLFNDMELERPLNIESWNLENCRNSLSFWKDKKITINSDYWRG